MSLVFGCKGSRGELTGQEPFFVIFLVIDIKLLLPGIDAHVIYRSVTEVEERPVLRPERGEKEIADLLIRLAAGRRRGR